MYTWVIITVLVLKIWIKHDVATRRPSALIQIAKKLEQHSVTYIDFRRTQ